MCLRSFYLWDKTGLEEKLFRSMVCRFLASERLKTCITPHFRAGPLNEDAHPGQLTRITHCCRALDALSCACLRSPFPTDARKTFIGAVAYLRRTGLGLYPIPDPIPLCACRVMQLSQLDGCKVKPSCWSHRWQPRPRLSERRTQSLTLAASR